MGRGGSAPALLVCKSAKQLPRSPRPHCILLQQNVTWTLVQIPGNVCARPLRRALRIECPQPPGHPHSNMFSFCAAAMQDGLPYLAAAHWPRRVMTSQKEDHTTAPSLDIDRGFTPRSHRLLAVGQASLVRPSK